MRHCGTKTIETPRLTLRPFELDDAQMMFQNWANDPMVTRYLRWTPHSSWAFSYELLNEWCKHYSDPSYYQWAISEKSTGIVFGSISICPSEPDSGWQYTGLDWNESWEPGYCIGQKWWGHGYTTEALRAVCDYWFDNTDSSWLACCHAVENPASGRVMQKAGFVYDHDAEYHKFDGTPVPCRAYFLTRDDITRGLSHDE